MDSDEVPRQVLSDVGRVRHQAHRVSVPLARSCLFGDFHNQTRFQDEQAISNRDVGSAGFDCHLPFPSMEARVTEKKLKLKVNK